MKKRWDGATCLKQDPEGHPCQRPYHKGGGHVFRCRTCARMADPMIPGLVRWDDWRRHDLSDGCVYISHARTTGRRPTALCLVRSIKVSPPRASLTLKLRGTT